MKGSLEYDKCSKCNVLYRLTVKGLVSRHSRFNGKGRIVCEGSHKAPRLKVIVSNA